jgi:rSAM/selenodomain-associated transferase 2
MDRRAGLGAQLAPCYRRSVKLSVVIPALDEAERIETAIRAAFDAPLDLAPAAPRAGPVEVIVVDGGSSDATRELAAAAGARVLACERGRARQLRAGVGASSGDVVLLLHADTLLPRGWHAAVCAALRDERVVGGAFRFRFDERSLVFRFIEFGARLRSDLWRLPYGDQALFVRRRTLEAIGGVPEVPVMEDLDLVQRMKRRGRLALLSAPAVTSTRRYRAGGPLRTMMRHWLAAAAWTLGVDRRRIQQWAGR